MCVGSAVKVADSLAHHNVFMGSFFMGFSSGVFVFNKLAVIRSLHAFFSSTSRGRLETWGLSERSWSIYVRVKLLLL